MLLVWGPHLEMQFMFGHVVCKTTNRKTDGEETWKGKQALMKGVAGLTLMSQPWQASVSYP